MRARMMVFEILVLAAALAGGCASSPASSTAAAPANTSGAAAPAGDAPKVVCHLSCSGTEATGYGATEAEARDDVSRYIDQNCKPEDGQYFVFCDPPT